MVSFCVLEILPQMPYANMQIGDYSLVGESKCWLLNSYLVIATLEGKI